VGVKRLVHPTVHPPLWPMRSGPPLFSGPRRNLSRDPTVELSFTKDVSFLGAALSHRTAAMFCVYLSFRVVFSFPKILYATSWLVGTKPRAFLFCFFLPKCRVIPPNTACRVVNLSPLVLFFERIRPAPFFSASAVTFIDHGSPSFTGPCPESRVEFVVGIPPFFFPPRTSPPL